MTRAVMLLCALVPLVCTGCPRLYDEYPPVAAEMLILGIDNKIRGEDFAWDPAYEELFTSVTLYLSETNNIDNVGDLPAEGAIVTLWGPNMGRHELIEQGGGLYTLDTSDTLDLRYGAKLDFELDILYAGKDRSATLWLPDAPWAAIPTTQTASSPMSLTLNPDNFDATVEVVIDQSGNLVHDTSPTSLSELLAMSEGDVSVGTAEIPGSVFTNPGSMRAVGVAGLRTDRGEENFENMNASSCRMVAGMMELYEVEVQ